MAGWSAMPRRARRRLGRNDRATMNIFEIAVRKLVPALVIFGLLVILPQVPPREFRKAVLSFARADGRPNRWPGRGCIGDSV
jgi:hypothetical protein